MDTRFLMVIAFPLALAACSSPSKLQSPAKNSGLEIFKGLIDEPAAPHSVIRQGDEITYMVAPTANTPWFARFDAACSEPKGSMFYNTTRGMKPFTDNTDSISLPHEQLQVLQRSEQLKSACAYRAVPDWRALDLAKDQNWLVLDRNSAVQEDGLLNIWTGRQLAHYQVGPRNTLIAQSHERLAIDCKQHTFKRLSHFQLDSNSRVFNGRIEPNEQPLAKPLPHSDEERLIEAACQPASALVNMAVPTARTPLMPQLETPNTTPAVTEAINALQLPDPRMALKSLQYSYDALAANGVRIDGVKRSDVFSRDKQSSQLLIQTKDRVLGTQLSLTFRGLITLAIRSFDNKTGEQISDNMNITDLGFKGDWQHLPEDSEVSYSVIQSNAKQPHTQTVNCKVGAALPANQIHSALQGMAKPLICTQLKPRPIDWTESFTYLEDYGVFVQAAQSSPLGRWTWRVESVH